ncbi:hypothetical protein F4Z99_16615 [Candidatus Poribacteria bacterium]|nr:hypothetical protein [Candidatus Poribacteria bacterium]
MKMNSTFHVCALLMAVLVFSIPFGTFAQQGSVQAAEAIANAKADANKDVNKPLWFGAGCLLSGSAFLLKPYGYFALPIGSIGGYLYQPAPLPSRLIGKSPEYIAAYTSTYKSKRGEIQANSTAAGCLSGCLIIVLATGSIGVGLGTAAATQ